MSIHSLQSWQETAPRGTAVVGENPVSVQHNQRIALHVGKITHYEGADAFVNAANTTMTPGGGVFGALTREGGQAFLDGISGLQCPEGTAVVSPAGNLGAKVVIHTTASMTGDSTVLQNCYKNMFYKVHHNGCRSIVLCALGQGIFANPNMSNLESALIAACTAHKAFEHPRNMFTRLVFCISPDQKDAYEQALLKVFPVEPMLDAAVVSRGRTVVITESSDAPEQSAPDATPGPQPRSTPSTQGGTGQSGHGNVGRQSRLQLRRTSAPSTPILWSTMSRWRHVTEHDMNNSDYDG